MNVPEDPNLFQTCPPQSAQRPLRLALLGYRSDPFVGGQGVYLHYLSAALVALGHHVDVYSGPPYPNLAEGVNLIKVPSLDLFASKNHVKALRRHHLRSFTDTWEWFSMLTGGFAEPYTFGRRVAEILENKQYDIIHDNQSLSFGLLKLQQKGFNVVSTIHHPIHRDRALAIQAAPNWQYRLLARRWYSFLHMQEKVVKKLDNIITVSHQSKQDIKEFFRCDESKIQVIANGIDTSIFKPQPEIKRKDLQLITTASADQPLKGLQYLLKSVANLRSSHPYLKLIVIGKLKPGGDTEKLITQLELENTVTFHSGISTIQLVKLYAESTIAVCPSLYEGFGLPAGEAMACGLPVISTNGGALPEVVGDAGIIVPAGNTEALADEISQLLADSHRQHYLGEKARKRILENFCWNKVARELSEYYQRLIAQNADR